MLLKITAKSVNNTLKSSIKSKITFGYETISREEIYSSRELNKNGNVKSLKSIYTRPERADIFFMALTGMNTDELAKKIIMDYYDKLKKVEKGMER